MSSLYLPGWRGLKCDRICDNPSWAVIKLTPSGHLQQLALTTPCCFQKIEDAIASHDNLQKFNGQDVTNLVWAFATSCDKHSMLFKLWSYSTIWWRKTAVTYKCQKRFWWCLGTYKCQSGLVGDQKLNKITSESQSQKLARTLSQAVAACSRCNMSVPIGGRAGQWLCGGGKALVLLRVLR